VQIEQAHERVNRQTFGLKAKIDSLEDENNIYRRRLYKRGKGDYR
jgi:hypothetical protein